MFPVLSDADLYKFTGGKPPDDMETLENWFTALESRLSPDGSEHWLTWVVQLTQSDTPIGYVQATVRGPSAEISWLIGTRWQANGYASDAVTSLLSLLEGYELDEVIAHIHPKHSASHHIARRHSLIPSGGQHKGEEIWTRQMRT